MPGSSQRMDLSSRHQAQKAKQPTISASAAAEKTRRDFIRCSGLVAKSLPGLARIESAASAFSAH
jgi:hypothetical protein